MYDPEHGWSLSFAGCGFMGFYHVGATRCLSEHAPHLLRDARMFLGCSAGALHCVTFLCGMPLGTQGPACAPASQGALSGVSQASEPRSVSGETDRGLQLHACPSVPARLSGDKTLQVLMDMAREARRRNIGVLHPSFNLGRYIRNQLQLYLPANVHRIVSGRVSISLTRVSDGENVLVSDFHSKEEVVDALLCSCFIPFYSGVIPPAFRGERYMDGGASDNVPCIDARTTITVSPFYGEHDICPKVKSTNFLHVNVTNLSLRLCLGNVYLMTRALFPPDVKTGAVAPRPPRRRPVAAVAGVPDVCPLDLVSAPCLQVSARTAGVCARWAPLSSGGTSRSVLGTPGRSPSGGLCSVGGGRAPQRAQGTCWNPWPRPTCAAAGEPPHSSGVATGAPCWKEERARPGSRGRGEGGGQEPDSMGGVGPESGCDKGGVGPVRAGRGCL
uniref:triacylglycerol lipase n=1 Tax=Oryctolagus cuniculus TaxID=9986 RepID=G1THC3_RABIT